LSSLTAGKLPRSWIDGTAPGEPAVQGWAYEPKTHVFRQSLSTHFEGPFVYLLIGQTHALLVDTGTGDADFRSALDTALLDLDVTLLITHTHGHSDHVGGDAVLAERPRTKMLDRGAKSVIDLGGRMVDVIDIPGHEESHVAFYDRKTGLLLTGDSILPGRIYVRDIAAFRASLEKLIAFVKAGHPVSHILGSHIEMMADGTEFAEGALAHPREHELALGVEQLHDLHATIKAMGNTVVLTPRPHYVVVPA
jgi:hydroxyacylglutathione hydrolase